jgi:hypothetical protein
VRHRRQLPLPVSRVSCHSVGGLRGVFGVGDAGKEGCVSWGIEVEKR